MDAKSYCDNVAIELVAWKAKVYDIVRRLDKMSSGDKGKVLPQVVDLHTLIEELDDRIARLRTTCPTDWSADKVEIESKFVEISNVCDSCWENISGGELGG
jgi:hypothetical protein